MALLTRRLHVLSGETIALITALMGSAYFDDITLRESAIARAIAHGTAEFGARGPHHVPPLSG